MASRLKYDGRTEPFVVRYVLRKRLAKSRFVLPPFHIGRARFEPYPLFQGPHPMFGLSGCEPCDALPRAPDTT